SMPSSPPRFASVSMRKSACSATDEEFAVPTSIKGTRRRVSAGTSMASYPTPMRATTSNPRASAHFRLAKARQPKDRAMYLAARPQQRVKIGSRDGGGKSYNLDVIARVKQPSAARSHDAGH